MSEIKLYASQIEAPGLSEYEKFLILTDLVASYNLGEQSNLDDELAVCIPETHVTLFNTQINVMLRKRRRSA